MLNRSAFAGESKCSICGTATAIYCCEECPGMHICENCNQFWHVKHPTRSHHTYSVMNRAEDSPTQQFNGIVRVTTAQVSIKKVIGKVTGIQRLKVITMSTISVRLLL